MNNITKVSEITYEDLADYLRISEITDDDKNLLNNLLSIAISYIVSYTGHTKEELDNYNDLIIAVFVLVQDMYDNRSMYVDSNNVNKTVDTILNMYSVNLLPFMSSNKSYEIDEDDDIKVSDETMIFNKDN